MSSGQREVNVAIPLTSMRSDLYWRRIFNKYDKDKDGRISYTELKDIIESREYERDLPDNVVAKIMSLADRDNSGYLEFPEFVDMMHNPDFKAVFGHFVGRYVNSIIPNRNPIDTTGCKVRRHSASVYPTSYLVYHEVTKTSQKNIQDHPERHGTYEEEYTCWPPAICMILVSLVEVALYCYDVSYKTDDGKGLITQLFIYDPKKRNEAWRFITYMLVHIGVVHLLVNLLVQLFLGVPLEMVHRWWRVLTIYIAGVLAGSLATSLTDPDVYLAGSSGGVYALIAAHIATIIMNWAEMEFALIQLLVFILIAVVDVGTAIYDRYFSDFQNAHKIGYVAHLAGAVAGLLVGIGILRNLEKRKWEKRVWWVAVIVYVVLMMTAILANIFWTDHFM